MHTLSTEMLRRGQCASTVNASQVAMTSCAKITRLHQTENRDEQSYHCRHSASAPWIRFHLRSGRQSRRISTRSATGGADVAHGGWSALAPDSGSGRRDQAARTFGARSTSASGDGRRHVPGTSRQYEIARVQVLRQKWQNGRFREKSFNREGRKGTAKAAEKSLTAKGRRRTPRKAFAAKDAKHAKKKHRTSCLECLALLREPLCPLW